MKTTCTILLSLLLVGAAKGQDLSVLGDTLDWHRYYPLEIGNMWEYGGLNSYTSTIVGDTLVGGHRYFIRRDSVLAVGTMGSFIHTFYHRYDAAGTVVTLLSLEEDTLAMPLSLDYQRTDFPDFLAHFDMRMAFGDTLYYGAPDTVYYVSGGFAQERQIGNELVRVDGLKCFSGEGIVLHTECYATDIGFVGGGNLFGSELQYVKVGGIELGTSLSLSADEETSLPEHINIGTLYPNPFKDRATITYRLSKPSAITVEVFNALGQRIWLDQAPVQSAGVGKYELESGEWTSGIYLVRLRTETGEQSVRSVVVSR